MFFCDAIAEREAERARLLQERNRLRAMLLGDADPEVKSRIEQLEAAIKRLDAESTTRSS